MKTIICLALFAFSLSRAYSQVYIGMRVPDVTETSCDQNSERIYDLLASGKPVLVFKTDMICSNTTAWGTTIRQYAELYANSYRTWLCADFQEATDAASQCSYMQQYEQQTGMSGNNVFRFIDTLSAGPYDPSARLQGILCYQGYIVIGLDSVVAYVGNDLNEAVSAALAASGTSGTTAELIESLPIFSNPVSNELNIRNTEEVKELKIYNSSAALISNLSSPLPLQTNISGLPAGTYFLHFSMRNGKTLVRKLLKP